jgi:hypothetical protein
VTARATIAIVVAVLLTVILVALFAGTGTEFLFPQAYGDPTSINIDPTSSAAYVNETFNVNITIVDVTSLTGWEVRLYYNNALLNCTAFIEGPFLQSGGSTFTVVDILNDFNSTHGRILAACALLGLGVSVNGSGVIATVDFTALAEGVTLLDLENTKLSDENVPPQPIIHTVVDGTVNVTLRPENAVDVYTQRGGTGDNVPSDAFAPSETIFFNASVKHQGSPVHGVIVEFITYDPVGTATTRNAVTDLDGIARSNLTLSTNPVFGNYTTVATTYNLQGQDYSDTVRYKVGWIVFIKAASSCEYNGTSQTMFARSTRAYMNVTLENISFEPKPVLTLVEGNDFSGKRVVHEWIIFTMNEGETSFIMGFRIPDWSMPGDSMLFICPYDGGMPYCPGTYITITITVS